MAEDHSIACFGRTVNACYGVTADLRIAFWNAAAELLFGRPAAEVVGQRCFETVRLVHCSGKPLCRRDCLPVQRARARGIASILRAVSRGSGAEPSIVDVATVVPGADFGELLLVHYVQPALDPVATRSRSSAAKARRVGGRRRAGLTPTERRCLALLADGLSTAAIAAAMNITHNTARNYVQHVMDKLGVHSRMEAAALGRRSSDPSPTRV